MLGSITIKMSTLAANRWRNRRKSVVRPLPLFYQKVPLIFWRSGETTEQAVLRKNTLTTDSETTRQETTTNHCAIRPCPSSFRAAACFYSATQCEGASVFAPGFYASVFQKAAKKRFNFRIPGLPDVYGNFWRRVTLKRYTFWEFKNGKNFTAGRLFSQVFSSKSIKKR